MDFDKELAAFKRMARKKKFSLQTRYGNWHPPFAFAATQRAWESWVASAKRADALRLPETSDEFM